MQRATSRDPRPSSDRFVFSLSIVRAVNFSLQGGSGRLGKGAVEPRPHKPYDIIRVSSVSTYPWTLWHIHFADIMRVATTLYPYEPSENFGPGALPNRNESEDDMRNPRNGNENEPFFVFVFATRARMSEHLIASERARASFVAWVGG